MLPLLCFGMFTLTKPLGGKMPNYQDLYGRTRRRELKNVGSYFKPSRAYNTHSAALGNQAKRHVVLAKKKKKLLAIVNNNTQRVTMSG